MNPDDFVTEDLPPMRLTFSYLLLYLSLITFFVTAIAITTYCLKTMHHIPPNNGTFSPVNYFQ